MFLTYFAINNSVLLLSAVPLLTFLRYKNLFWYLKNSLETQWPNEVNHSSRISVLSTENSFFSFTLYLCASVRVEVIIHRHLHPASLFCFSSIFRIHLLCLETIQEKSILSLYRTISHCEVQRWLQEKWTNKDADFSHKVN